ncbi:MAG: hypothetical protein LBE12_19380 [Planctomycetaceae bacterium]|jgi:hypothetical protein|nr:hypothetical protein [Planctomycetaceae bacterium]
MKNSVKTVQNAKTTTTTTKWSGNVNLDDVLTSPMPIGGNSSMLKWVNQGGHSVVES